LKDPSLKRLMKMNASEWPLIVIGCLSALAQGAVQPGFAILFGAMLGVSLLFVYCRLLKRSGMKYNNCVIIAVFNSGA